MNSFDFIQITATHSKRSPVTSQEILSGKNNNGRGLAITVRILRKLLILPSDCEQFCHILDATKPTHKEA